MKFLAFSQTKLGSSASLRAYGWAGQAQHLLFILLSLFQYAPPKNFRANPISDLIQKVSLPPSWADKMIAELEKDKEKEAQDGKTFAQNLKAQIKECEEKLDKLLDAHLEGVISKEEYLAKKQKIFNQKIEISEKLKDFERKGNHWLEPAKNFILAAKQAKIIALQENLFEKKDFLKKIGSNRILRERKVFVSFKNPWKILANLPAEARSAEAAEQQHTIWLPGEGSNLKPSG